jgi:hypothetical protein
MPEGREANAGMGFAAAEKGGGGTLVVSGL